MGLQNHFKQYEKQINDPISKSFLVMYLISTSTHIMPHAFIHFYTIHSTQAFISSFLIFYPSSFLVPLCHNPGRRLPPPTPYPISSLSSFLR
ncbi:hypothetical protein RIF29_23787 [Crotalaria pallida]|uniref:Uncharacterized protein n=1 Tax=Crotalaria pallida TaxID=3830 RepID=A0AAN9FEV2_CROPI